MSSLEKDQEGKEKTHQRRHLLMEVLFFVILLAGFLLFMIVYL